MSDFPVAVVGVGHLGTYHARIWNQHPDAKLVGVVDPDDEKRAALAAELSGAELSVPAFANVEELLAAQPDVRAVSVAVPTVFHAEVAVPLLERGIACLIEKPLAANLEQADRILEAAEKGSARLSVGHVERFQPGLRKVREMGLRPRFIECHRLAPFSFRSTDIGVVHDLMIHDLDLILDLLGDTEIESIDTAGGAILTENADIASVRLVFQNGARANVTASRVALQPMRRFRLFSAESYVSLDFHKNYGLMVRKGPHWDQGLAMLQNADPAKLAAQGDLMKGEVLDTVELELGSEERPLQAELDSFLQAVRANRDPEVTGRDGRRALELAERINAAIQAQTW